MANVTFWDTQSRSRGVKLLTGVFKILGNTTPANGTYTINKGNGFATFVRSGAGEYTITLNDSYVECLGVQVTLQGAAIDLVPQVASTDVVTAKTIVINLNASGTPTDTANTVVQYLHVLVAVRNTSVLT